MHFRLVQAAWVLTNIAEDARSHCECVVAAGAVAELVRQVGMYSRPCALHSPTTSPIRTCQTCLHAPSAGFMHSAIMLAVSLCSHRVFDEVSIATSAWITGCGNTCTSTPRVAGSSPNPGSRICSPLK